MKQYFRQKNCQFAFAKKQSHSDCTTHFKSSHFNSPAHEFPVAARNSELSVFVNDFPATDGAHSHTMTNHPFEYVEIDRLMVGLGRYGSGTKASQYFVNHAKRARNNKAWRLLRTKDNLYASRSQTVVRVPPVVREGFSGGTRAAFLSYSKSFINSFLCYNSFVCYGNVANSFICYINLKFI